MVIRNLAFSCGSSKQGNARLAYVGSKLEVAKRLEDSVLKETLIHSRQITQFEPQLIFF